MSRKLSTTVYVDEEALDALAEISRRTRVPVAALIREGIDLALAAHADGRGFSVPEPPAPPDRST